MCTCSQCCSLAFDLIILFVGVLLVMVIYHSPARFSSCAASVQSTTFQGCCCLYNQPQVLFITCGRSEMVRVCVVCDSLVFVVLSQSEMPCTISAYLWVHDKGSKTCFPVLGSHVLAQSDFHPCFSVDAFWLLWALRSGTSAHAQQHNVTLH